MGVRKLLKFSLYNREHYPLIKKKGGNTMDTKYFTLVRKDVLDNNNLSLGAKGLYCLICYDLTVSLRNLLIDPTTKKETIKYASELMKYDYAHFDNIEECVDKYSPIGLHVSIQPNDDYKNKIDKKNFER